MNATAKPPRNEWLKASSGGRTQSAATGANDYGYKIQDDLETETIRRFAAATG